MSSSEASRITDALRLADKGNSEAIEKCLAVPVESVSGECMSLYASRSLDRNACEKLDGFWRDECHFMWAEAKYMVSKEADISSVCSFSGTLRQDCMRHLEKQLYASKPRDLLPWKERLRHSQPLSVAPCATDRECEEVVSSLLVGRWERELSDPPILASLCSGQPATGRFAWVSSPPLDTAMDALRARHCATR